MQWIAQFVGKPGSLCPGFYRLRYLAACPHGCTYCFLQGTYWRGRPRDITEADLPEMERAVERWMQRSSCEVCHGPAWVTDYEAISLMPAAEKRVRTCLACQGTGGLLLNAGEMSDSFAPAISAQTSLRLIELFRRQRRHTLLLVTKARPTALFEIAPTPQVIISFSLGQQGYRGHEVAPGTAAAAAIRESAVRLHQAGWRLRLRIDPLIDEIGMWRIISLLQPVFTRWERITLGTLRFTRSGYRAVANGNPTQRALAACVGREEQEAGSHPYRLRLGQRKTLYAAMLDRLHGRAEQWALCKETAACWRATLGTVPTSLRCNCTL